jgi:hypothetical protein
VAEQLDADRMRQRGQTLCDVAPVTVQQISGRLGPLPHRLLTRRQLDGAREQHTARRRQALPQAVQRPEAFDLGSRVDRRVVLRRHHSQRLVQQRVHACLKRRHARLERSGVARLSIRSPWFRRTTSYVRT